jgi:hypothetical protein
MPDLTVKPPVKTRDGKIIVRGKTQPGASVTVNGKKALPDPVGPDGKFETTIEEVGVTDITVDAALPGGGTEQVTIRNVGSLNPFTYTGKAAANDNIVLVEEGKSWASVTADGNGDWQVAVTDGPLINDIYNLDAIVI